MTTPSSPSPRLFDEGKIVLQEVRRYASYLHVFHGARVLCAPRRPGSPMEGRNLNQQIVARGLLVALCALQGIATAAIDLNRTHATNPKWTGHARFHVIWQTASVVLLAFTEIALVLAPGGLRDERFYCAAILAAVPMCGFFCALVSRRIFESTLSDPTGMKPLIIRAGGSNIRIDLNLVAEICGVLALAMIVAVYAHANRP